MELRLLILEDSKLDIELMFRELNKMEITFISKVVSTKSEYSQVLHTWNPDLIISDYNLETFSADEILAYTKQIHPNTPIIILSGGMTNSQEIKMLANRANDVLSKDNLKRLPFAINRVLKEKRDKERLNNTLYQLAGNLNYQEALAEISLIFNTNEEFGNKMNKALAILGTVANVSRVYVFEAFDNGAKTKNTFEWCGEGVEPQIDNLQNLSYEKDLPTWKETLLEQGKLVVNTIAGFNTSIREILEPQEIKSIMVFPLHVDGNYLGFIGFDEVREEREWSISEDKLLHTVSGIIGNAYSNYQANIKLIETNAKLNRLLVEKEALVGEVHHRVKNNLALISSFLQLDQLGIGVIGQDQIISANVLRIKSIAIIHEIIYESGSFSNISVCHTTKEVLKAIFSQEKLADIKINVASKSDDVMFNINQAVPFSLLLSEMIFEAFRLVIEKPYAPKKVLNVDISEVNSIISLSIHDKECARIVNILLNGTEDKFSEIFTVLTKQLNAKLNVNEDCIVISFKNKKYKGSSSSFI